MMQQSSRVLGKSKERCVIMLSFRVLRCTWKRHTLAKFMGFWYHVGERRQAVAAFSTSYMGFRWSVVQIHSPRFSLRYEAVLAPHGAGDHPKIVEFAVAA
jgi:hypothetical protein